MAKKTIGIEVEYPDCSNCGREVNEGETYGEIDIKTSLATCKRKEILDHFTDQRSQTQNTTKIFCNECLEDEDVVRGIAGETAWSKLQFLKERKKTD